ncbi:hypothetical protein [Thermodesulforhabdus norvegica]|uniref:Transposase (putative) YhgA-like domain-containing protein n=1 Tax=Thermodesulforhabdus norvegica TaxID=39841 RepID=A0A1I4RD97_9BACT|nr:hypothetical protein [Thermodesulforhabdus norvegica]SFM50167.1 hypothetical protein SAMN05660836_00554 [Thermodesulforhabdus norvegica]
MSAYDAAVKAVFSWCRDAVLEYFLGLDVLESEVLELPQETVTIRRADIPIRVRTKDGRVFVVLLEVQSKWQDNLPLRLLEYDVRYRIKTGLSVLPAVLLLRPGGRVTEEFSDGGIHYRFKVVSLAEMDAREAMAKGKPCLLPFVPLMKGGTELLDEADKLLNNAPIEKSEKIDLISGLALLTGLVSKDLCKYLLQKRRNIIMESFAYEIIKKEGFEEGLREGLREGLQEGLQKGLEQGMVEEAREMVIEALCERFGSIPEELERRIRAINSRRKLKELHRCAIKVESIEKFTEALD